MGKGLSTTHNTTVWVLNKGKGKQCTCPKIAVRVRDAPACERLYNRIPRPQLQPAVLRRGCPHSGGPTGPPTRIQH